MLENSNLPKSGDQYFCNNDQIIDLTTNTNLTSKYASHCSIYQDIREYKCVKTRFKNIDLLDSLYRCYDLIVNSDETKASCKVLINMCSHVRSIINYPLELINDENDTLFANLHAVAAGYDRSIYLEILINANHLSLHKKFMPYAIITSDGRLDSKNLSLLTPLETSIEIRNLEMVYTILSYSCLTQQNIESIKSCLDTALQYYDQNNFTEKMIIKALKKAVEI